MSQPLQAPWYIYAQLPPSDPQKSYHIIDAHPSDIQRVVQWYQFKPVPGFGVIGVRIIHNPEMGRMFQGAVNLLEKRHNNSAFNPKWEQESATAQERQERQKAHNLFRQQAAPHHYQDAPHTSIVPLWHGTSPAILDSLFNTGYANLATTDSGFFGKGLYNTHDAEYAHRVYSKGALLVNFVAVYSIYPVIHGDMPKLKGQPNYQNYDGHFVPVCPKNPNNPNETVYYPCKPGQEPTYTELVVFEASRVLPRYIVELGPLLTIQPPAPLSVLDINNLIEALLEYQLNLDPNNEAFPLIDHQIAHYGTHNTPLNPQEITLHNLIKRISVVTQPSQQALFNNKVVQLIQQLNAPQPAPMPHLQPLPKQPSVIPSPQPSPKPVPLSQVAPNPVILQQPVQLVLPPMAFGKAKWAQYFGDIGIEPSLPPNIHEILNATCAFWPGKKVHETHLLTLIPRTVNGKPFTLNSLSELIQKPQGGGKVTKYVSYWDAIQKEYGNTAPNASYWALLTKDVIPDSRNKKYDAQRQLLATYSQKTNLPYEVPLLLETATSLLMEHVQTGTRLYSDNPSTYTRCQERVSKYPNHPLVVGGFAAGGLLVYFNVYDGEFEYDGLGGCRRF